jgi:hypothetical protein
MASDARGYTHGPPSGGHSPRWVAGFFLGRGYRLFDGDRPRVQRTELAPAPWNTIAIPVA